MFYNHLKYNFRYFRRRLRVTLVGDLTKIYEPPIELHSQQLLFPELRYMDFLSEKSVQADDHPLSAGKAKSMEGDIISSRRLPVLALNDVFVGESLSSRVSYLVYFHNLNGFRGDFELLYLSFQEVKLDNDNFFKTRNSGLCIRCVISVNSKVQIRETSVS